MSPWITPDILPPTTFCRRLLIPDDPKWIATITGAILPLIYAAAWEQVDGITAEEAAERAEVMFNQYLVSGENGECVDMGCCPPEVAIRRYDPDTGRPQVSYDGGVTWGTDPDDPENLVQLYPPLVNETSGKTKCDAATNASEHVNELIDATGDNLSVAASVTELAIAVAETLLGLFLIIVSAGTLTAPVTAVATAIWAAASGVFALGIAGYNTYWTVDKKDAILCAIFCNIGEDGQFTEAQYQAFRAKVKATLPASPAFDIVMTSINAGGARGLSQMASYGNAALADCSACDCGEGCSNEWFDKLDAGYYYGTIIAQDANSVTVQCHTPNINGAYYGNIWTNSDTLGCYLIDANIEIIEGTGAGVAAWRDNPGSGGLVSGLFGSRCVNWIQAQSSTPFTVKYTFSDCP